MERLLSPEQLREVVYSMLDDPPIEDDDDFLPEPPRPRPKPRRKAVPKSTDTKRQGHSSDQDLPFDPQLDLFDD